MPDGIPIALVAVRGDDDATTVVAIGWVETAVTTAGEVDGASAI